MVAAAERWRRDIGREFLTLRGSLRGGRPVGLGASEDRDHLGAVARHLEQFPAALAHVGPPAEELLPLFGRGPEDPKVRHVLPVGRVWLARHWEGSSGAISRVLFTRWCEQMVISLGWLSPATSCGLPAAQMTRAGSRCLLGLAPTGGCRATPVARRAVGSYPTVSPLPFGDTKGGLFSVALSVALRRPGVTWRSTLWSSDFPRVAPEAGHPRPPHPT